MPHHNFNFLFEYRLHYKLTCLVFLGACLMATTYQTFGDRIECIVDGVPTKVFETHCWTSATFTLPYHPAAVAVYPGVSPYQGNLYPRRQYQQNLPFYQQRPSEEEVKYHPWYQWVGFFLLLEAGMFYIPRYYFC